jgi:hypothetical protein
MADLSTGRTRTPTDLPSRLLGLSRDYQKLIEEKEAAVRREDFARLEQLRFREAGLQRRMESLVAAWQKIAILKRIPFTGEARACLQKSFEEAYRLDRDKVDPRHLVLGILAYLEEKGDLAEASERAGLEPGALRRVLLALFPEEESPEKTGGSEDDAV